MTNIKMSTITFGGEEIFNITDEKSVHFNKAQTLTEEEKKQARTNIGAVSAEEVGKLSEEKVDKWDNIPITLNENGYVSNTGILMTNDGSDGWNLYSDSIPLGNAKKIKVSNIAKGGSYYVPITFMSDSSAYADRVVQMITTLSSNSVEIDVPDGAKYVRLSSNKTYIPSISFPYNSIINDIQKSIELLQNKFVDIRNFGACDSTDITLALQNAIDYCHEHNTVLYIPSNNYVVSSPIIIYEGIRIVGDNAILKEAGTFTNVSDISKFTLKYSGNGYLFKSEKGQRIDTFYISGVILVGENKGQNCICVNGLRCRIEHCSFANFDNALYFTNDVSSDWLGECYVNDNYFWSNWSDIRFERTEFTDGAYGEIIDSKIYNNIFVVSEYSVYGDFLTSITFTGNHDYSKHGIRCCGSARNFCVHDNYFDNGVNGSIKLQAQSTGCSIKNNNFLVKYINDDVTTIELTHNYSEPKPPVICVVGNQVILNSENDTINCNFIHISENTDAVSDVVLTLIMGLNEYSGLIGGVKNSRGNNAIIKNYDVLF